MEGVDRGTDERQGFGMLCRPCGEIAGHAEVRCRVDAVWREVNLKDIVGCEAEILGCRSARLDFAVYDDDAVVALTDAYLVFGAYHAE